MGKLSLALNSVCEDNGRLYQVSDVEIIKIASACRMLPGKDHNRSLYKAYTVLIGYLVP